MPVDDLGANEATSDIGVDLAARLDSIRALTNRPGPDVLRTSRKERDQLEHAEGRSSNTWRARLFLSDLGEKQRALLGILDLCEVRLEATRNCDHLSTARIGLQRCDRLGVTRLGGVGDVHHWLRRQEIGLHLERQRLELRKVSCRRTGIEHHGELGQEVRLGLGLLLPHLDGPLEALQALRHQRAIGKQQLEIDALGIRSRIETTIDMEDRFVFEGAHDVDQRVCGTQGLKKLAAEPTIATRATLQASHIDQLHRRRHQPLRIFDRGKWCHPCIWHLRNTRIDRYLGRRERLDDDARTGQRIEDGGLAAVRQTDDSDFEASHSL